MSDLIMQEDGYYSLTAEGVTAVTFLVYVAILLAAIGIILSITRKKKDRDAKPVSTKQLVFSAVALALAFPLSYIKLLHLPWGGSVTLCSMFFVTVIGYWYEIGRAHV